MRVVIHAGLPKCASTSVQAFCADHDSTLQAAGLLYPTAHRMQRHYRSHAPLMQATPDAAVDTFLAEARDKGCHTILLSTEAFSTDRKGRLAALTRAFARVAGVTGVECVFLIREPVALLRSSYQQFVRAGLWWIDREAFFRDTPGGIEDYIAAFEQVRGVPWYAVDRLVAASLRDAVCGRLHVWDIDGGDDPVARLCRICDLPPPAQAPRQNTRFPIAHVKALRDFQRSFGVAAYRRNERVLLRKLDLSVSDYDADRRFEDGLDIDTAELHRRFPEMERHRQAALALRTDPPA